ncbi:carboxymuconolactone decarboxylase family protein [Nonomuraea sp. NBC_01738]|uniref:carboxymuconolactone decarboxylase family protein n=1 Tax=Nonomuraea sp. NBC_01738 TaxID=2976003 RepID=UPI002E132020|nr:carboxymuconolactone decarboxylase family protein [Nonomuraea sp. NBC_01738]
MTFLNTPVWSALYQAERAAMGYVPNYAEVFALRPEVYAAWRQLSFSVRSTMDPRRYELATLAASLAVGSAYCTLAHAAVLRERFYDDAQLGAIVRDHRDAGLDPLDVAVMDFAGQVAAGPDSVTEADIEVLRGQGLSDGDVFQLVLAACLRRFFSGVLSAVDAVPDDVYAALGPEVRSAILDERLAS